MHIFVLDRTKWWIKELRLPWNHVCILLQLCSCYTLCSSSIRLWIPIMASLFNTLCLYLGFSLSLGPTFYHFHLANSYMSFKIQLSCHSSRKHAWSLTSVLLWLPYQGLHYIVISLYVVISPNHSRLHSHLEPKLGNIFYSFFLYLRI